MKTNNSLMKSIFSASGIIIIAKIVGFFKEIVVASSYGTSVDTDLLNLSQSLISDIKYVLVQVLLTSFVVVYINVKQESEYDAKRFTGAVIVACLFLTLMVMTCVIVFSNQLSYIISPSFSEEQHKRLSFYISSYAPTLLAFVAVAIFNAVLSSNKIFIPGQLEGFFQSCIVIMMVEVFSPTIGIVSLYYSLFVFSIFNMVFMWLFARRYFIFRLESYKFKSKILKMFKMALPLLIGYSAVYLNQMVDKVLLSSLGHGTVTSMHFASSLHNIVGSFIVTFAAIVFPYVADLIAKKDIENRHKLVFSVLVLMVIAFLPVSIISIICAKDVVTVVFARGAFDDNSVNITSLALIGYGFCFVPLAIKEIFSRYLYANFESKVPMRNSVISILINIGLSIALCKSFGVIGVTLATSISILVCGVLNYFASKRYGVRNLITEDYKRMVMISFFGSFLSLAVGCFVVTVVNFLPSWLKLIIVTATVYATFLPFVAPILKLALSHLLHMKTLSQAQ